jgi:hypothetical protein
MQNLAAYCDTCDHKSVCKIRQKVLDFDQSAKDFEEANTALKITIINVNYSCIYKEKID